jgi:hypothetical protein
MGRETSSPNVSCQVLKSEILTVDFISDVGFLGGTRPLKPMVTEEMTGKQRLKLIRSYEKACLDALEKVPEVKGARNSNKVLVKDIWEDGMA